MHFILQAVLSSILVINVFSDLNFQSRSYYGVKYLSSRLHSIAHHVNEIKPGWTVRLRSWYGIILRILVSTELSASNLGGRSIRGLGLWWSETIDGCEKEPQLTSSSHASPRPTELDSRLVRRAPAMARVSEHLLHSRPGHMRELLGSRRCRGHLGPHLHCEWQQQEGRDLCCGSPRLLHLVRKRVLNCNYIWSDC